MAHKETKSQGELMAAMRSYTQQSPRSPVTVFHHIPKCGGTSIKYALANWFIPVSDYRSGWTDHFSEKINIDSLRSAHCLCGHYEFEGNHLHQRYPEIFPSGRFRVFTFIRDPLQVRLSLYRYEKKHNVLNTPDIEDHLFTGTNYISCRLPATLENYKEIIDRYFFVGILEEGQASLDILARLLGKPRVMMPWKNNTGKDKDTEMDNISADFLERFREENSLDYLIYDYCIDKFRQADQ